jgi:molybdopterin molybdotransferase
MLSLDRAMREVVARFAPTAVERVALKDALGLCTAEPLLARFDAPGFDNSAMDGYAVRAADVVGASETSPVVLPLVSESRAGGPSPSALPPGHAAPIFTGAALPAGADAIVVREDATRADGVVSLRFAPPHGHHVRRRSEDLRVGDPLIGAGTAIDGGVVALLASQGHDVLAVHRRPRVAVLTTGDELRDVATGEAGTLLDSNGPMLDALIREAGGEPVRLPRVGDALEPLKDALHEGLRADLLVTTGGVSVGDHDHVRAALEAVGIQLAFWKVALKPGKPLVFGTRDDRGAVLGLPGNPVSAFVTFHLFVRPVIRSLLGDAAPWPALRRARLGAPVRHATGRTELLRARLEGFGEDERVEVLPRQGSGALASLGRAEVLVVVPAEVASIDTGEPVWVWPLRGSARELPTLCD